MRLKRIDFYSSTYSVLCVELNGFYFEYMTFFTSPIKNEFRVYLKNSYVKSFNSKLKMFDFIRKNRDLLQLKGTL